VKNAEKADDEYKKSVEKLKNMESRFYDSEMPQILAVYLLFIIYSILSYFYIITLFLFITLNDEFRNSSLIGNFSIFFFLKNVQELQSMEEARVAMMKTSFSSFVTAQATVHPAIKSSCEAMSSVPTNTPDKALHHAIHPSLTPFVVRVWSCGGACAYVRS
jgi:hypothetical protein